jgi:hypothetical protein
VIFVETLPREDATAGSTPAAWRPRGDPGLQALRAPALLRDVTPVVLDVHHRSGVAGLRALGEGGLRPVAVGRRWSDAGLWSRYARAKDVLAGHGPPPQRLAAAVGRTAGAGVAYPGEEPTIDHILAAAAHTPQVVAPFPAKATRLLRHKAQLAALAHHAGIAVPRTWMVAPARDVRAARVRLPCAVKSEGGVGTLSRTYLVETHEELEAVLGCVPDDERIVVQERLGGPLVCLALVLDRAGAVVARFQYVAETTWPASAGPTARAVSVAPDSDLVQRSARMLRSAGYWGLVQLDFLPGADGLALIDANPRFYAALALATRCGVNLPAAWHGVVAGAQLPSPGPYRLGLRYRWLEADVVAALRGLPERLRPEPGRTTGAMWEPRDPAPAALLAASALASRPIRRVASGRWRRS